MTPPPDRPTAPAVTAAQARFILQVAFATLVVVTIATLVAGRPDILVYFSVGVLCGIGIDRLAR